jgi:hypothetical protein
VVDQLASHFIGYELIHVDRGKNEEADELCRVSSRREQALLGVFLDQLHNPTIKLPKEIELATPPPPDSALVAVASARPDWTETYMTYLLHRELPDDGVEAR